MEKIETSPMFQRETALERKLEAAIGDCKLGRPVYAYDCVSSTMDVAHALAKEGAPEGTLVWAQQQTKGRGRLGRVWESPPGGAYFSIILRPTGPVAEIPQLSRIAGLALAEAIKETTGIVASIKWPNDLLLNGKKLAGILIETRNGATVIGIGINVTIPSAHLPDTATALILHTTSAPDPLKLTGTLCQRLSSHYNIWSTQRFAPVSTASQLDIHEVS